MKAQASSDFNLGLPHGESVARVGHALTSLGTATLVGPAAFVGRIMYGFQPVRVRVECFETDGATQVVILAASSDIWGVAARNVVQRLEHGIMFVDHPNYRPDRLGIHASTLALVLLGFGALLAGIGAVAYFAASHWRG